MDAVIEEPIRLKAELVKTREVIAKKFRQSQKERVKRERAIDETFTPIAKTFTKLLNPGDGDQNSEPMDVSEFDNNKFEIDVNDDNNSEGGKKHKKSCGVMAVEKVGGSGNMAAKRRLPSKKRGAGGKKLLQGKSFIPYNSNIVYEYYDDPNELCDWMRLLKSSQTAGNTNHTQEINSILEELYERKIIL